MAKAKPPKAARRGFTGRLADPAVRRERAQRAGAASAAARKPEGMARRLIGMVDQLSPEIRAELHAALVALADADESQSAA